MQGRAGSRKKNQPSGAFRPEVFDCADGSLQWNDGPRVACSVRLVKPKLRVAEPPYVNVHDHRCITYVFWLKPQGKRSSFMVDRAIYELTGDQPYRSTTS